jgi:hypothetical protein
MQAPVAESLHPADPLTPDIGSEHRAKRSHPDHLGTGVEVAERGRGRCLEIPVHAALIRLYLQQAGFESIEIDVLSNGSRGDPLIFVTGCA